MKIAIIVQARINSSRLPGKVLKTVLGKPLLAYQIERLQNVRLADEIIIATTTNEADQSIIDLCDRLSVKTFCGPELDVLTRYYDAATLHAADVIVRVTSDCPLIDPSVIDQLIQFYLDYQNSYDYVSNCLVRTYPRGMDTEVFSYQSLQEANSEAVVEPDREHVTPFIHRQPQRYRLGNVRYYTDQSHHRWTVDTPEDFELIRKILEALHQSCPHFTLKDCLQLLAHHPDWSTLNAHIEQKLYGE